MNLSLKFSQAAVFSLLLATTAAAQEKKIERSALPPAVEKTVVEQSKGADIRGFAMEIEDGKTSYEAQLLVNGHSKDIQIDPSGEVTEIEEQVELNSLPSEVRDGLQTKAGKGKLVKVESLTKHEKLVAYEAQVLNGKKKSEVQVGPNGKPLDHEE